MAMGFVRSKWFAFVGLVAIPATACTGATGADALVLHREWGEYHLEWISVSSMSFAGGSSTLAFVLVDNVGVHGYDFTTYISTGGVPAQLLTTSDQITSVSLSPDARYLGYTTPHPDYLSGLPYPKVA